MGMRRIETGLGLSWRSQARIGCGVGFQRPRRRSSFVADLVHGDAGVAARLAFGAMRVRVPHPDLYALTISEDRFRPSGREKDLAL
jgi:hypothetical protein